MIILSIMSFTPLVIPPGKINQVFCGLPYTLWAGMLVALGMIILTIIGAWVHPDRADAPDEEE